MGQRTLGGCHMNQYREEVKQLSAALLVTAREVAKEDPQEAAFLFGLQASEVRQLAGSDLKSLIGATQGGLIPFRPRHLLRTILGRETLDGARALSRELARVANHD
jgi:hypothetical protein